MRGVLGLPRSAALAAAFTLLALGISSALAACGDGVLQAGEACDASAPGGDAACPGACVPSGVTGECTCALPSTDARHYVLVGDTLLKIGKNALVLGGNVGVVEHGAMLAIGAGATLPGGSQAVGDVMRVYDGAHVGRLFSNVPNVRPTAVIAQGGPFGFTPPLFVLSGLPPFPSFLPGNTPVQVGLGGTLVLQPGSYGNVVVGQNGTLILHGLTSGKGAGVYEINALRTGFNAQVVADNPVVMNIFDRIAMNGLGRLGPAPATGLIAGDIQLNVTGKSVRIGRGAIVAAHIRAPHAKAVLGQTALLTGRLIAPNIVTQNSRLAEEGACGDGLLGSGEQCDTSAPGGDARCPGQCIPGDPQGAAQIAAGSPGQCTCRCTSDNDCSDGNACNGAETCQGGVCVLGLPLDCNDHNPCTRDCDPNVGCVNTPLPDGTKCSDGNACTTGDTCQGGVCAEGPMRNCDDKNACTTDACDPSSGCTHTPVADGTSCPGTDPCTLPGTCHVGRCVGGGAVNCGDNNPCTDDSCDPLQGCTHSPLPDGAACSDANACTTNDTCLGGICVGGPASNCDDGNPCTADSCDATLGCQHSRLQDGTGCGAGKTCHSGVCS
jgi:hypothetical protein